MNFDYLNSIPDREWNVGADGHLRRTFPVVELCRSLGIDPSPEWEVKFDFLGNGQPRCYRHWPCSTPGHTEVSCLPADQAVAPRERTGAC